jgi:hypothetical protein
MCAKQSLRNLGHLHILPHARTRLLSLLTCCSCSLGLRGIGNCSLYPQHSHSPAEPRQPR